MACQESCHGPGDVFAERIGVGVIFSRWKLVEHSRRLGRPRQPKRQVRGSPSGGQRLDRETRVCVVGSGWTFVSGISAYTCRLTNALAEDYTVSAILMRRLLPRRLYPGADRVGKSLMDLHYRDDVEVFDGVDYFWVPSMIAALRFLLRERPDVIVLQWWSGTVLHSYLALAAIGRLLGARVVIEFHELQDTGEVSFPLVHAYVAHLIRPLLRLSSAFVVHSEFDREGVREHFGIQDAHVVPHGPYDHLIRSNIPGTQETDGPFSILFFGTIRPYKGLENLVEAFGQLGSEEAALFRLLIVGETWEGWDLPAQLIAANSHRELIVFDNRYVRDDELADYLAQADAVVLPYLRSSSSGPLHLAMAHGLPVVVTDVGGLREAAGEYPGAQFVQPGDVDGLRQALLSLPGWSGTRYQDPHSWDRSRDLLRAILSPESEERPCPPVGLESIPRAFGGDGP